MQHWKLLDSHLQNSGAFWLLSDHLGNSLFHNRRADSDLWSLLWAVESVGNLYQKKVIFEISSAQACETFEAPESFSKDLEIVSDIRHLKIGG